MSILKKPLVTEKISSLNKEGGGGVYGLIVDDKVGKITIKKAIESFYGVTVVRINTMRYAGKIKTRYARSKAMKGKGASYKKALVKLKEGDMIDFYGSI